MTTEKIDGDEYKVEQIIRNTNGKLKRTKYSLNKLRDTKQIKEINTKNSSPSFNWDFHNDLKEKGELFRDFPPIPKIKVSNLGRIRINRLVQEQFDIRGENAGYLVLVESEKTKKILKELKEYTVITEEEKSRYEEEPFPYYKYVSPIYKLVANTWLGESDGRDVHHIDNNGYNNSVENLIYLTCKEHAYVHKRCRRYWCKENCEFNTWKK
ncbi:MAG: HNH endonuclease [Endomicrobia bacterium]|nr:HNH endonuclease [Endomicrobiia bacterium]MCL2507207.1 HNH endonuclease [Endomicrobiia bacterium]